MGSTNQPGRSGARPPTAGASPSSAAASRWPSTRSRWASETRGPISVEGSSGSPTRSAATRSASAATNAARIRGVTITRLVAVHFCPVERIAPATVCSTACVRSASSSTTTGFLPPSSSWTFSPRATASRCSIRPTAVEPVKVSASIAGSAQSAPPTSCGSPQTTCSTSCGSPASHSASAKAKALSGVTSDGFSTTALPNASAGARLPRRDRDREVPRRDRGDDAERLALRVEVAARRPRSGRPRPARRSPRSRSSAGSRPRGRPRRAPRRPSCPPRACSCTASASARWSSSVAARCSTVPRCGRRRRRPALGGRGRRGAGAAHVGGARGRHAADQLVAGRPGCGRRPPSRPRRASPPRCSSPQPAAVSAARAGTTYER